MFSFRCPKCQSVQDGNLSPGTAVVICPSCGARLQTPEMPNESMPNEAVSATPSRPAAVSKPAAPARPNEWFCTIDGQHRGPLTESEMQWLADREELQATDLVWRTGWPQWRPARQFFQFPEPRPRSRPRRRREYDDQVDDDRDRYDDRYDARPTRAPGETASLTCGILSIVGGVMSCIPCSLIGIPFGLIGLVLACVSMSQGREKALGGIGLGCSLFGVLMNVGLHVMFFMNNGRF